MALSYLEYLKNKNNINNQVNALNNQLMQDNSWLEVSRGHSNNSGTISDLNFINTQKTLSNKSKLDAESNNNDKQYNANKNKYNFSNPKDLSNNMLSTFAVPSIVKGSLDGLYGIANSGVLDNSLDEILTVARKATKAINGIFKGLF